MIGPRDPLMTLEETGEHAAETHAPDEHADAPHVDVPSGPTAAQLRRFIKSRPYVPLHELRRRFELNGDLDEVCAVGVPEGTVFVGLPRREADFLATLVRDGEIGLELSKDPVVPIVVGVFAMKQVTRP